MHIFDAEGPSSSLSLNSARSTFEFGMGWVVVSTEHKSGPSFTCNEWVSSVKRSVCHPTRDDDRLDGRSTSGWQRNTGESFGEHVAELLLGKWFGSTNSRTPRAGRAGPS
eukprot:TRINITY_DN89109_c0_g1_i1.p3 TRINITY_DN89109_c0_g1~~TRINITY_DN89109_c0_g1_i1.p3  ORF type:complete len:110 (-),score=2.04 TRINITY_DN89109_c0_g1_i1:28-357(-)